MKFFVDLIIKSVKTLVVVSKFSRILSNTAEKVWKDDGMRTTFRHDATRMISPMSCEGGKMRTSLLHRFDSELVMFSFISSFLETPESGTSTPEDLLKAVTSDNVERASYVLSRSVNVNTPLDLQNNDTALHIAARRGLKAMAACLIDNGADLHALNTDKFTPLHCSILAADGSLGVATLLLERGAETHRQGNTFQLLTSYPYC